jgi:hypothetical protein
MAVTVVVDTTAVFSDVMLSGTNWLKLLRLCADGEVSLAIPEIVLLEGARHRQRQVDKSVADLRLAAKATKRLRELGVQADDVVLGEEPDPGTSDEFIETLRERLEPIGAKILPIPPTSHEQLVRRDLDQRKPFSESGKGYRDALIWESVKALASVTPATDRLIFVTGNQADFCNAEGGLHPDLAGELSSDHCAVAVVKDLAALFEDVDLATPYAQLRMSDAALREYLSLMGSGAHPPLDEPSLSALIQAAVVDAAEELEGDSIRLSPDDETTTGLAFFDLGIPSEVDSPQVGSVEVDANQWHWQVYDTLEGGTLLAQAAMAADVEIQGYVYKGDYHILDLEEIAVLDWDWNEHMARVSTTVSANLLFQVRVEADAGVVDHIEFEAAEKQI